MLIRPGSQADMRRKLDRYRQGRDHAIAGESEREKYFAEKAIRDNRNKENLLFFIDCLKEEFPEEQFNAFGSVFEIWAKRRYAREATLAYHDIKRAIGTRNRILYAKLGRCQAKLLQHCK